MQPGNDDEDCETDSDDVPDCLCSERIGRSEEFLLTVSHSKGSQVELMQLNKAGLMIMENQLSKGSLSLWAVSVHNGVVQKSRNSEPENVKGTVNLFLRHVAENIINEA